MLCFDTVFQIVGLHWPLTSRARPLAVLSGICSVLFHLITVIPEVLDRIVFPSGRFVVITTPYVFPRRVTISSTICESVRRED